MLKSVAQGCCGLALAVAVGCGSSETTTVSRDAVGPSDRVPAGDSASSEADRQAAQRVVSQFLDRIRRGAEQTSAHDLLTDAARRQINLVGGVQSIGAPEAQFTVTRAVPAPAADGGQGATSMLVHSLWAEPVAPETADATVQETQVVWAVQREQNQWRISGMVIELAPGQPPTVIDFENGQQMATLFGVSESETSQAAAPGDPATVR